MISQYDLYDISFAFAILRNDVKCESVSKVLLKIENVLIQECDWNDNQIRKEISSIENLDKNIWGFAYHNNVYVNCRILKDKRIYDIMIKICRKLIQLHKAKEFDEFYELIDSVHCLPEIIADNKCSIPNEYWKKYINPYRKKRNKDFLLQEQKILKDRRFIM